MSNRTRLILGAGPMLAMLLVLAFRRGTGYATTDMLMGAVYGLIIGFEIGLYNLRQLREEWSRG